MGFKRIFDMSSRNSDLARYLLLEDSETVLVSLLIQSTEDHAQWSGIQPLATCYSFQSHSKQQGSDSEASGTHQRIKNRWFKMFWNAYQALSVAGFQSFSFKQRHREDFIKLPSSHCSEHSRWVYGSNLTVFDSFCGILMILSLDRVVLDQI